MFGVNGMEAIILLVVAALVIGPERMPLYARKFAQLVKDLRRMAHEARRQLAEEVGQEFDWEKVDPRPMIKDALGYENPGAECYGADRRTYPDGHSVLSSSVPQPATDRAENSGVKHRPGDSSALFDIEAT